jgi:hypothetical protein
MSQPASHRVPWRTLTATTTTPPIELARLDPTSQHRTIRLNTLTSHPQPELIEATEHAEIRAREGSVKHVEVFQLDGVRISIIGRPRPSPDDQHATAATPSFRKNPIVCQHLTVARVAEALAISWDTANNAVLDEGRRVLISDPHRLDGVRVVGVDEHAWRHTRRGYKYVTVIIDLTPSA